MRPAHLNHLLISLWRWDTFFRPIKSFHHVQHQRHNRTWWWCWHSKNLVICRKYIAYVVQAVYISHGQNVTADFLNFFRKLKVVMHKCSAGWSLFLFKINNDNIVLKMTLLSRIITTALKIIVFSWIIAFYLSYAIFPPLRYDQNCWLKQFSFESYTIIFQEYHQKCQPMRFPSPPSYTASQETSMFIP